jgi:hypothetical protein
VRRLFEQYTKEATERARLAEQYAKELQTAEDRKRYGALSLCDRFCSRSAVCSFMQ